MLSYVHSLIPLLVILQRKLKESCGYGYVLGEVILSVCVFMLNYILVCCLKTWWYHGALSQISNPCLCYIIQCPSHRSTHYGLRMSWWLSLLPLSQFHLHPFHAIFKLSHVPPIRSMSLPPPTNTLTWVCCHQLSLTVVNPFPFSHPYTPVTRWEWGSQPQPPLMLICSLCIIASNYYPLMCHIQSSTSYNCTISKGYNMSTAYYFILLGYTIAKLEGLFPTVTQPPPYNHLHLLPTHPICICPIQSSKSHNPSVYFHWYHCPPFYPIILSSNCGPCSILSISKLPHPLLCAYLPPIVPHPAASYCAYVPLLIHLLVYRFYVSS